MNTTEGRRHSMETSGEQTKQQKDHVLRNFFIKLAAITLSLFLILNFVFGIFRMNGNEMYPAVRDGDLCITYRLDRYYQGDIVAYRTEDGIRFARVIAREGDTVDADEGGLLVNGVHPMEEIFYPTDMESARQSLPCEVREGEVFVLNDYRPDLNDSRRYGTVSTDELQGKMILILRRRGF